MMICRYFVLALFVTSMLNGCASRPIATTAPLNPAATINTLTSAVAVSVKAGENGISGRGYLIMRYPDQFRMMIISPFGTTLAEMCLEGNSLLYLDSAKGKAYQGLLADLPDVPILQGWRLLRWATERVYPELAGQKRLVRNSSSGKTETIEFDSQGLVLKKSIDDDEVRYEGYQSVDGVAVPSTIEITDRAGITVRITLDEPEVNNTLDEKAFIPALDGFTILPLNQFPTS
jgi:outer membrane biogenesis lipoprotein LolB